MQVFTATDAASWDAFLARQPFRPFLQSWTMGEVYRDTNQEPIRLEVREGSEIQAVCLAIVVHARRGRHLMIPYGPVVSRKQTAESSAQIVEMLLEELMRIARGQGCAFIRMSPFWPLTADCSLRTAISSPLHLLAEHLWYLPLVKPDPWSPELQASSYQLQARTEEQLLMAMRKTTRNLIRRAEKDGVTVEASADPNRDIEHFLALHEETRQRHGFTPYTNAFFRAQVRRFAERKECTLYLARFQGEVAAASIHMHAFGETSYHHGASTHRLSKVPTSYLLQWTAIRDALKRGDRVYNFWGIAPVTLDADGAPTITDHNHPFSGVTLFKTGFGGSLLPLAHCMDFPLSARYHFTRAFELIRKWRRGF
ncbi:MAG: peptidoglycan bridge formation glycyltransferase FemA/FemB family protein [Candidatus Peribacteraceae bacterium]|nr:peptidoglycan bridge formation glycyltransferase FemA/FemB family protein [Candidatus Peribacteraceae bacterium]MDD5742631.1 peptidoglycan bridge formation glycyltransferase FemA/FemB family protein [Candidatus Peribacteraceae bacterium]